MIKHHPNTNILSEYAAGSLGVAESLAVSAHKHYCHQCRQQIKSLEMVGGTVLESSIKTEVSARVLDSVLEQIEIQNQSSSSTNASTHSSTDSRSISNQPALAGLPPIVAKLIGNKKSLQWKKLSSSLQIAPVVTGQQSCEVSLHKIAAGGKVMEHDHRGAEYTLVLKGSFSDEGGIYQPGDFLVKHPGEVHRPYAAANRDCLCLTVVEAPVRLTGLFSRWLNPFLRIQPL